MDGQSLQEDTVNSGVLPDSFFGCKLILLYINNLADARLLSVLIILLSTLSVIRHIIC